MELCMDVKLCAGKYMRPVTITKEKDRLFLKFQYNQLLMDEIKAMQGARYHGFDDVNPRKLWSIADSARNRFQLAYLAHPNSKDPLNPYFRYDQPLVEYRSRRPVYNHQLEMIRSGLTYRQVIWAVEMGCVAGYTNVPSNFGFDSTLEELYNYWKEGLEVTVMSFGDNDFKFNYVRDILDKGIQVVVKVKTETGREIVLTPDHEIYVASESLVAARDLRINDLVLVTPLAFEKVTKIEDFGEIRVYDIVCRDPYRNFVANGFLVHNCGKTLSAIEVLENSGVDDFIWVGPQSALYSVQSDFNKWEAKVRPKFYTYESLKKLVESWPSGKPAPKFLVVDECSKCKNPTAQRTQAVMHLADSMRAEYGNNAYIILMSGSPAPKSPADWFALTEIACPGFIKEGNINKFRKRLAVIEDAESLAGGRFPKLKTWKDDPKKCNVCGEFREHEVHDSAFMVSTGGSNYHCFQESIDEISFLYRRMKGLVTVKFKKSCLDLPDKIYKTIECKPTQSTLNAARAITAKSPTTIQALTLLRELSDGFQYSEAEVGFETCNRCNGVKVVDEQYDVNNPDERPEPDEFEKGHRITEDGDRGQDIIIGTRQIACQSCYGTGSIIHRTRTSTQIACPKEDALIDLLEEHNDIGRIVIFGGFTGTIDRCWEIVVKAGWIPIRVDGRGWKSTIAGKPMELLRTFQEGQKVFPKVAFIAQPGAGGMGLNLTTSPTILYYSNDFNAESRIQSEDRAHRIGMDVNRGCTIVDLIHLPTDLQVLNNLKEKRRLQDLSLGVFEQALNEEKANGSN